MTNPKYVNDLLILDPSFSLSPSALVFSCHSEPAKSTILSAASFYDFLPPSATFKLVYSVNTA